MVGPKYTCGMGDPLDMLGEECTEIAQAIFKLRRFGPQGAIGSGYDGPPPLDQIHQEIGDFMAVFVHLVSEGFLDPKAVELAIHDKRQRVKRLFGVELSRDAIDLRSRKL